MIDDLPPLPEKEQIDKHLPTGIVVRGYTAEQMQAYARAAIERKSVPAGWKLVPIEPSDEWIARLESQQTGALEAVDADAIRQCIVELLAAAPQPQPVQEPVAHFGSAYVNENGVHITTVLGPVAIPQDAKLYTSPQAQPLTEADPFTYVIQHLNSSPYALTKDECITKIKELRALYQAQGEAK